MTAGRLRSECTGQSVSIHEPIVYAVFYAPISCTWHCLKREQSWRQWIVSQYNWKLLEAWGHKHLTVDDIQAKWACIKQVGPWPTNQRRSICGKTRNSSICSMTKFLSADLMKTDAVCSACPWWLARQRLPFSGPPSACPQVPMFSNKLCPHVCSQNNLLLYSRDAATSCVLTGHCGCFSFAAHTAANDVRPLAKDFCLQQNTALRTA